MPKPADLEAQLAQQLRTVQAQAAALVGAVSKGARHGMNSVVLLHHVMLIQE